MFFLNCFSFSIPVQQHQMLIAIGYSARPFGIVRGMSVEDAKLKCPDLVFAKVEMINDKPNLNRYRQASVKIFEVKDCFCFCFV